MLQAYEFAKILDWLIKKILFSPSLSYRPLVHQCNDLGLDRVTKGGRRQNANYLKLQQDKSNARQTAIGRAP